MPGTPAPAARPSSPFKDLKEKFSYALGMSIASTLKRQAVDVDLSVMERGLRDGLSGTEPLLSEEEMKAAFAEMQAAVRAREQARAGENLKAGQAFLEANKAKPGVVVLPSGLQYKILVAGNGPKPRAVDTVLCNYRGTLIDGTEFDSSYKRGEPATFPVGRVIRGWSEALQLMPVGSKWQLFVPAELAYGERSPGPEIPANSVLVFEIELLSIQGQH
ncbi:MAG TPA: FKBP-type peptidyl-prolyl cis-trans isomerase [Candidatus Acidoferrales bacterium]|nr:FKBP-type peptidyl-prolyl cis-trans isomerase [Candidatus Acidoferrales bacterium]